MKVTVKTNLNVRVGRPSVNAPCYQYLAPGSELEVDGRLYEGDPYEGSNLWIKDGAENYYWAKGTDYALPVNLPQTLVIQPAAYEYWHLKNGVKALHDAGLTGSGRTVCIIDSGVAPNCVEYNYNAITRQSLVPGSPGWDDKGHGSKCLGIVHCQGKRVAGIAPLASILAIQVSTYSSAATLVRIQSALDMAIDAKPDVVSVSLNIPLTDGIRTRIGALLQKGVCVTVAHGNKSDGYNALAAVEGVISVGGYGADMDVFKITTPQNACTIAAPGGNIYTTNVQGMIYDSGTSFSNPYVAAVCAIIKQARPAYTPAQVCGLLVNTASHLTLNGRDVPILNLPSILQQLKPAV